MAGYYKKDTLFKKIFFSRGMSIFLLVVLFYIGYGLFSIINKSMEAGRARALAESEAQTISKKNDDLSQKLELLKTPEGKEAALRERFPVVKKGENVVVIVNEQKDIDNSEMDTTQTGFWYWLKNLFR